MLLRHFYYSVGQADMAQEQHHARTTIRNTARGNLKLVRGDEFAPATILQGQAVFFVTKKSEGYVIYEGPNVQGGPPNCGWLLAWNVRGHGNQVCINVITSSPRS